MARIWRIGETPRLESFGIDCRHLITGVAGNRRGRPGHFAAQAGEAQTQAVEVQVNHRRGVQRQQLADSQAADDGDAQRAAQFSEPGPVPSASGKPPSSAAMVVISDRPEAQQAGLEDRLLAESCPSLRSASIAKSIIMMAFFLTMPISRMMPISAMTLRSVLVSISASSAPTPAEGSVERIVMGWM